MSSSNQYNWWKLIQDSKYPAYVTLIHPNRFGVTTSKGRHAVSEVAVDDPMHRTCDAEVWQPPTITLKKGSCVLVLPEDATSPDKATVSQPWMVRVSGMWFTGDRKVAEPREQDKEEEDVIKWERQQLRSQRLSTEYFSLECNYFYRLNDFPSGSVDPGSKNGRMFAKALVTLGIADSIQSAEELMGRKGTSTRAGRLLNKFVVFSTHVGRVSSEAASSGEEDDEGADDPIPMESVMGTCHVWFLGAKQPMPSVHAPVAAKAEEAILQTVSKHHHALLTSTMEALRQQHTKFVDGYFCSLLYVKQTDQLVTMEDWASGKARSKAEGRWVKQSRQLAKQLLEQSQKKLASLQGQAQQDKQVPAAAAAAAAAAGPASASAGDIAAAAGDADDAVLVDVAEQAEEPVRQQGAQAGARPATPPQQQHSQQLAAAGRQPQRRTPRKSGNPRMAAPLSEQPQSQRGRLRSAAAPAAAAATAAGSDLDIELLSSGEDEDADPADQQQQQQQRRQQRQQEEEEEEAAAPAKKRRQAAVVQDSPSSAGSEESSEESNEEEAAGSEEGGSEDEQASSSSSGEDDDASLGDQPVSSSTSEEEDSEEAAAEPPAAAGKRRGRGRPPGPKSQRQPAAAAVGGGKQQQQHTPRARSSGFKSSKGAVLSGRKRM